MKLLKLLFTLFFAIIVIAFFSFSGSKESISPTENSVISTSETAYFASGCFWCVESIFESLEGVEEAISGYAGGHTKNPTYRSIGTGTTGHSETVAVYYNPKIVSFKTLVTVFFGSHDPTTKNGQHPDYGSQYRSIAFYQTTVEKEIIETAIKKLNQTLYNGNIVTEVTKLQQFYEAEAYHQNFERLNPNNPYVRAVSVPRLNRFKKNFFQLLKEEFKK